MELKIENMTCGGCARAVTKTIHSVDPAASVEADPATHTVRVETSAAVDAIGQALAAAGYPAVAN